MAIATATLAAIGTGLTAGGKIGGAILQNKANNRALQADQQATNQALLYQRERDALEDKRYQDRWDDYMRRHQAWEQRNFGGGGGPTKITNGRASSPAAPVVDPAAAMGAMGGMAAPDVAARPEGQTLADWSDWRNYIGSR